MSSSSLIDLSKVRVLCVDDDPLMRAVVRAALQKRGCRHIEQAQGGHEALDLCASHTFDLLICDYQMAPMDGLMFLRALCDAGYGAGWPVIMLSAEGNPATIAAAQNLGISAWVPKPISVIRLIERIGAVLGLGKGATGPIDTTGPDATAERYHTQMMAGITALEDVLATLPYRQRDLPALLRALLNTLHHIEDLARTLGYELVSTLCDRAVSLLRAAERDGAALRRLHVEIGSAIGSITTAIRQVARKRLLGDGGVAGLKLLNAIDDSVAHLRDELISAARAPH